MRTEFYMPNLGSLSCFLGLEFSATMKVGVQNQTNQIENRKSNQTKSKL